MTANQPISREQLKQFTRSCFEACGVPEDEAAVCADVLVAADSRNIPSHGVARLKRYVSGIRSGLMKSSQTAKTIQESPVSLLIDADGSLGAPVSRQTMQRIIEKADHSGMAFGCVRNSNHFGIAGYYAMMALEYDMIGVAITNTAALGVPTFGRQVMFGTNPLAFAAPADTEKAFVLDMSTTAVTRGKVEIHAREGKPLEPGWAVDKNGQSASEAAPLLTSMFHRTGGGLVPLGGDSETHGGHKGYGLAVMADILTGVLSGSLSGAEIFDEGESSARVSHCFGAMKINLFMPAADFRKRMDRMLAELRLTQPADAHTRVYYAGLKESLAEEESAHAGIFLDKPVIESLLELSRELNVPFPHP